MVSAQSFRDFWLGVLFWGMVLWVFSFFVSASAGSQDKIFYYAVAVPVLLVRISGGGGRLPSALYGVLLLLFLLAVPVLWNGDAEYLGLVARYLRYLVLTSCVFLAPFLLKASLERLSGLMLWAIIGGAIIAAVLQWLNFVFVLDLRLTSHGVGGVGGIGINPNVTGAAMGVALLAALSVCSTLKNGWCRALLLCACLLFLSSMGLALARTAFVAVAAVLVLGRFPLREFWRYYLLAFMGAVLLAVIFWIAVGQEAALQHADRLLTGRVSIWRQLLSDVSGHWWFGLGLQRDLEFYTPGLSRPYMTAHNIYFQAFRNGGFFALTALVALVLLILRNIDVSKASKPWGNILFFGLIYALVDAYYYPVSDPNSNWLFLWLPAGYLLVAGMKSKESQAVSGGRENPGSI